MLHKSVVEYVIFTFWPACIDPAYGLIWFVFFMSLFWLTFLFKFWNIQPYLFMGFFFRIYLTGRDGNSYQFAGCEAIITKEY